MSTESPEEYEAGERIWVWELGKWIYAIFVAPVLSHSHKRVGYRYEDDGEDVVRVADPRKVQPAEEI